MDELRTTPFLIKTYERPGCLARLLQSITRFAPRNPIIIGDDSLDPVEIVQPNVTWYRLPVDVGLGAGRNMLLDKIDSPVFFLLDDDYIFTHGTRLNVLYTELLKGDYDIVGGRVYDETVRASICHPSMIVGTSMKSVSVTQRREACLTCDFVPNFFLARTEAVKKIRWDDRFKIGAEHMDFFIRAKGKLKIGFCNDVVIHHNREPATIRYAEGRRRSAQFAQMYAEKHHIVRAMAPAARALRMAAKPVTPPAPVQTSLVKLRPYKVYPGGGTSGHTRSAGSPRRP